MAVSDIIARRYARAYFDVARESEDEPAARRGLAAAAAAVQDGVVSAALANPRVEVPRRVHLLEQLLEGEAVPARNLTRLLVERGRAGLLPRVLDEYDRLADAAAGRVRAEVITAVELDGTAQKRLAAGLRERLGSSVETTVTHDPSIVGGLVIRIGDRVIDGSVRTRLQQLQAALA